MKRALLLNLLLALIVILPSACVSSQDAEVSSLKATVAAQATRLAELTTPTVARLVSPTLTPIQQGETTPLPLPQVVPTPTPSPISSEENIIANWKITILDVGDLPYYGYINQGNIREGHRILGVDLAVENVGEEVLTYSAGSVGSLVVEDDRGFTYYPIQPFQPPMEPAPPDSPRQALVLPGYRVHGWIGFTVPLNASGLQLVISSRKSQRLAFDLQRDITGGLRFPSDDGAFKALGQALTQDGVISITPLRAMLYLVEEGRWVLYVQFSVENLYGYDLGIRRATMQVLDDMGYIFDVEEELPRFRSHPDSIRAVHEDIGKIPPGFTRIGFAAAGIRYSIRQLKAPEQPTGLKLLVLLSESTGKVKAPGVYAVYDLGKPTTIQE